MGLRSPGRVVVLAVIKLVAFVAGALLVVPATTNVGSAADIATWWTTPIAIQKFAVWTLLWEVAGLGVGFGTPGRGALYWMQPGTTRKPPWPARIPSTAGSTREFVDAALYIAVLIVPIGLLTAGTAHGHAFDTLPPSGICALLGCLALLGLRDRTAFLAARPELLVPVVLVFAFEPGNLVFAVKLALAGAGAAVATARFRASLGGFAGTAAGYGLALVLLFARGGVFSGLAVGLAVAVIAYAAVASRALETCAFVAFAVVYVFGHYAEVGAASFTSPTLLVLLPVVLVVLLALAGAHRGPYAARGTAVAAPRLRMLRHRPEAVRPTPAPRPSPRPRPAPALRPQPRGPARPRPTPRPSPGIIGT